MLPESYRLDPPVQFFGQPAFYLFVMIIPIFIGIAILHSRLWDIDVLINRAHVYSGLSGTLVLIYAAAILGLQLLLGGFIQGSQFALFVSTLTIAALFQPLRHRIQNLIDRRFYRRKYDADHTIAVFGTTLQAELDLDQLSQNLIRVVVEAMQPTRVSLWLVTVREKDHPLKKNDSSDEEDKARNHS